MNQNNYSVPITHTINWNAMNHINALIAGSRGSGKSFLGMSMVVSMATFPSIPGKLLGNMSLPTQWFVIDLKNADMARLSAILPKGRVASNKHKAIEVIDYFLNLMHKRMEWINNNTSFGATARSLGMPLFYLLIDEYSATTAAFNEAVTKQDKADKYHWFSSVHRLMMLGRQLGFGTLIITQQASDINSGLSSALKEEFGLKVHMGAANNESYRLTFGNEVKIPDESVGVGEGLLWLEGQTDKGFLLPFSAPFIHADNFWDILKNALSKQSDDYLTVTRSIGTQLN
ncbi:FtsK/SpoIIIE family protein [Limosilactobacillus reuteri]|uniref:Cell division protein FtsK n=2 Tax=Limosilactobacillus TaxID=2742598 RepID=A0A7W3YBN9_9LACO|nr:MULTISPECIES: cell division protein FtsK [Limosilactobacillus]MBB1085889.1 cell division protein FtsK [Limosilactobacillus fastidiosus]MCD7085774.1 cell division protein FtsK [Limosilactobacillus fastidiosus]MCD7113851.1 cell division protein FtsK [Limosilactobacillus fastidiosus]MCD7115683.1 cell division protein FtsK [Limosilactobacillus fastidiosus]CUR42487.1 FtsK/SpoIIIE family protein [Limosilactobacillus reuteri]